MHSRTKTQLKNSSCHLLPALLQLPPPQRACEFAIRPLQMILTHLHPPLCSQQWLSVAANMQLRP